jgi:hypothetical protein
MSAIGFYVGKGGTCSRTALGGALSVGMAEKRGLIEKLLYLKGWHLFPRATKV